MTKFVWINKEHSRTALIFCFHLKKTAAESYQLLGEAYGEHAPLFVNDDFSISKLEISMLQTRNTENHPKSTKTWNCKHCWMKMIHKHKNNSQSNWALINKLFPIAYERWERFRKSADEYTWVEWETDGEAQKHMCNFARTIQKKVIVSLLGMKSGFFLRIPSAKNHG